MEDMILTQLHTLRQEQQSGFSNMREEFNTRFDKLVSRDAFDGEQQRVNDRLSILASDIADEKLSRAEATLAIERRMNAFSANLRWVIAAVALPLVLFLVNLVVTWKGYA